MSAGKAVRKACIVCGEDYMNTCPNCGAILPQLEDDDVFGLSGQERQEDCDNTIPESE